jgi:hypothetical protein
MISRTNVLRALLVVGLAVIVFAAGYWSRDRQESIAAQQELQAKRDYQEQRNKFFDADPNAYKRTGGKTMKPEW